MPSPALIIFDIDGTLLQTERVTVPAVQRTLVEFGLPEADAAAICAFFGRPVEEYRQWLTAQCPEDRAPEVLAATDRLELELVGAEGVLYPGAREMLQSLKNAGHGLAICSNGPQDYVDAFLDAHRVRPLFDHVRCRGMGFPGKHEMIRELVGLADGRPAVVVGDRRDDVEAAHENGALAVGAAYGFGAPEELADADARVDAPGEIPDAIRRLLERRRPS